MGDGPVRPPGAPAVLHVMPICAQRLWMHSARRPDSCDLIACLSCSQAAAADFGGGLIVDGMAQAAQGGQVRSPGSSARANTRQQQFADSCMHVHAARRPDLIACLPRSQAAAADPGEGGIVGGTERAAQDSQVRSPATRVLVMGSD